MTKYLKHLLILVILLAAFGQVSLASADGGLVFKPYWTFHTDAPVTRVQTGDINGDGVEEIVILTGDNWIHILESDGSQVWRYEMDDTALDLLVTDLDGDGQTAEIYIGGATQDILLDNTRQPVWNLQWPNMFRSRLTTVAADLDGDGDPDILFGDGDNIIPLDGGTGDKLNYRGPLVEILEKTHPRFKDISVGDIDGDGLQEVIPSPVEGSNVYVFDINGQLVWQKEMATEVGLVQSGDVDGDGQIEIVVLSTNWELFLLEGDGRQAWHHQVIADEPVPVDQLAFEQLLVKDLNGDQKMEIVLITPTPAKENTVASTVHVFNGEGHPVWQQPLLNVASAAARLIAGDVNGDGQAEVVITTVDQEQVHLLAADGHRLTEYHTEITTGTVAYTDLNSDGWGEVIVGTKAGVQVFGTSHQAENKTLWPPPRLGETITDLHLIDLNGDAQDEILTSTTGQAKRVQVLSIDGQVLWKVEFDAPIRVMNTGDVDNDSLKEIVAIDGLGRLHLIDDNKRVWTVPVGGGYFYHVAVIDLNKDGQAEIVTGTSRGVVASFDNQGNEIWRHEFAGQPVTALGNEKGHILVGTQNGRVYRLTTAGLPAGEYDLGARVLSFGQGLAATANGQIYRLDDNPPTLVRQLENKDLVKMEITPTDLIIVDKDGNANLITNNGFVQPFKVDDKVSSIAAGDLNGDGVLETALGTDDGQIYLFGLAGNQPVFLSKPDLSETRTGYTYSVNVNDPEGDGVPVTLEIWDPSTGTWLTKSAQSLLEGQDQGRLIWEMSEPFDMWDSGQESRFRFVYNYDGQQNISPETLGPFSIPTTPWYVYYGQRLGLAALVLLVPALGFVLYRRQRAYRRSPVGRAETLLGELQANPDQTLTRLYALVRNNSPLLTYLPDLAREAGDTAIADLGDGLHLILLRPEVTTEDLRMVKDAIEHLNGLSAEQKTKTVNLYNLFLQALEANTVPRIIVLQPVLVATVPFSTSSDDAVITQSLADLSRAASTLHNYQRVDSVEDKIAYLGQALEALGRLERKFRATLLKPECNILTRIAANWLLVTNNALQDLQGRAQIEVTLKTRQLLNLEQVTLPLELTNTGRSPASNIIVTLIPDQTFAVSNGTVHLDILPAGRSAMVEVNVSAAGSIEQFRAEFNITFDDRECSGKSLAFADMVHLLKPGIEFQPVPNPYAPGTPLASGSPIFFGRDDLFQFISENIAGLTRQNILVLIGQRRMGKTSFLKQLPARLGDGYLPVYIDGQSLGIDPGMTNFFYDLSLAIVDALIEQGVNLDEPEPEDFEARPSTTFERTFLPAVFEAIGRRQLLLLFDEFEELEMRVSSGKLEPTIFPFFRHLMQHSHQLGFIFVGTHRLESLSSDYWSIFFNIALYKHVVFLDEPAAHNLIIEPVVESGLMYDDLALDKMLRVTAGHPYFLQLTCHALVNRANREQRNYLTIQDVNNVLEEMVELGEAHFAFLWEQSTATEQLVLATLSRLLNQEPTATAAQVAELLAERGVPMALPKVSDTLRQLVARDVVREVEGQPPRYEYKIELIHLWVGRYKALGRVVEEVA